MTEPTEILVYPSMEHDGNDDRTDETDACISGEFLVQCIASHVRAGKQPKYVITVYMYRAEADAAEQPYSGTFYCALLEPKEHTESEETTEITSRNYTVEGNDCRNTVARQEAEETRKLERGELYDLRDLQRRKNYSTSKLTN